MRFFLLHLQDTRHNPGGVFLLRAAKAFFSWLLAEELTAQNPMVRVRAPRVTFLGALSSRQVSR